MLIYCDSVILMYFFDHAGPLNIRATNRLAAMSAAGDIIAISDLVRLEYRVGAIKNNDVAKLAIFDAFCAQPGLKIISMASNVFERATKIRAMHRFKLADSLHLAAAVESSCDRFLTNDARLSAFSDIPIEMLP